MTDDVTRGQFAWSSEVEKLRAELAAANEREQHLANQLLTQDRDARGYYAAEKDAYAAQVNALQARLERIRALADEWANRVDEAYDYGSRLRAALDEGNHR